MPGFGSGPFGHQPFGEWKWSRRVLFEYVPEVYKQLDADSGGLLESFSESLRPSFDNLRHKIRDMLDLRDPLLVRTQYDEVQTLKLGPVISPKGNLLQRGVTASVDGSQQFNAPTARFRASDVGNDIFVSGSSIPQNNRRVAVTRVVSPTAVLTDPLLATDAGPLRWELRARVDAPDDRITVEVRSGDISTMTPGWSVFDGFADFTVITRRQFTASSSDRQHLTEQEGTDGTIDSQGRFQSATVVLTQLDVGKHLTLVGSSIPTNNTRVEITKVVVVAPGDVRAELSESLSQDVDLTWAILPYAQLDLAGTAPPKGVVEQQGVDLTITASGSTTATVSAPSASFSSADVGKRLSLRGSTASPSNDGSYLVTGYISSTSLTVQQPTTPLTVETTNQLTWDLRTSTGVGDFTQVDASAPSLITSFAPDFGIEVDTQESEDRQRNWVKNVSQWIELKGTSDGYRIIGAISGFTITTFPLFRISNTGLLNLLTEDHTFEVGEVGSSRSGTNGTVTEPATGEFHFSSPTAAFTTSDVGRQVRIRDAAVSANDKLLTIDSIVSATEIVCAPTDTFTLPDANNGSLTWAVARVYTDFAPLLPLYDEVNSDLMEKIVDNTSGNFLTFRADKYCWEDDFNSTVLINVLSVANPLPGVQRVSVTGTDTYPTTPEVVLRAGHWQFTALSGGTAVPGSEITGVAPTMTLVDVTALFTSDLVGRWIRFDGSTMPLSNDGTFLITNVLNSTQLQFFNGLGASEPGFPGTYTILTSTNFYVETVPVLTAALDAGTVAGTGTGDSFAQSGNYTTLTDSAAPFSPTFAGKHILIVGATSAENNGIFLVTAWISTSQIQFKNINGVSEAFTGTWSIGLGVYTFDLSSSVAPAAPGQGLLEYQCPVQLTCDYCGASKVLALIEPTAELTSESGLAIERLLDRVLARLDEVTPAHVELIVRYRASLSATLSLSASVEGLLT